MSSKTPIKKRTSVLTNSRRLYDALHGRFCDGSHTHQVIQGSEGGMKRSTAAQEYPPQFCHAICEAFLGEQKARHWGFWKIARQLAIVQLSTWHKWFVHEVPKDTSPVAFNLGWEDLPISIEIGRSQNFRTPNIMYPWMGRRQKSYIKNSYADFCLFRSK